MIDMKQFFFNLEIEKNYNKSDFFVNFTNKEAFDLVSLWQEWHNKAAVLFGESKSGKSHLGNIWAEKSNAKLINLKEDNLEKYISKSNNYLIDNFSFVKPDQENIILDIFNKCSFNNNYILFVCDADIKINFNFKDLESRFNSILSATINKPDDQIIEVIMIKFFSDHQVLISIDVIKYLSSRLDRSYKELYKSLEKINSISLKNKQKITIPFLRENFFN